MLTLRQQLDARKGPVFDVAIALGPAASDPDNDVPLPASDTAFCAEIALDGTLRPVRGALAMALTLRENGIKTLIVAKANGPEAALVDELDVFTADSLGNLIQALRNGLHHLQPAEAHDSSTIATELSLADVTGQNTLNEHYASLLLAIITYC